MTGTITIFVATMSGTAELVAEEVAEILDDDGYSARILRMEKADVNMVANPEGPILICSSTYGTGDVPDNGAALYEALKLQRPDLTGVRYGVVALGHSIYPQTFCFGGKRIDELLSSLGATRVGDRLELDSGSGIYPEEAAAEWARTWLASLA